MITTVVVLHELAHAFTKFHFHDIGVGVGGKRNCGESGWLVEEQLMGGRLLAEWTNKQHFGDMFRIDNVLLKKGSNNWELGNYCQVFCDIVLTLLEDVNMATTSLASLRCSKFVPPLQSTMRKHMSPHGSCRGRVTDPTHKPKSVPIKPSVQVGLRIWVPGPYVSYIGEDRL